MKLVLLIAAFGIVVGALTGSWFGRIYTAMYAELFRFPLLIYRPSATGFGIGAGLSLAAALAGAFRSVRKAARLPPAQAMQPPAPATYRRSRSSLGRVAGWLDQPTRIILRNMARWPWRTATSCLGLAFAVGVLVLALQWSDSIQSLVYRFFFDAQHQHATVGLTVPRDTSVLHEVAHMPGVLSVEGARIVAADLAVGPVRHRGSVIGLPTDPVLQPIYDESTDRNLPISEHGLTLSTMLAEKLGVSVGDRVWVHVREGRRPSARLPVAALFETGIGMPAYTHFDALHRLLDERPRVGWISLLIDLRERNELFAELKRTPAVSSVLLRDAAVDEFNASLEENMMIFVSFFLAFSCALGFGVSYNSARIALSERGRELATLRVLGFRKPEVAYILLGEVALLVVLSLPLGCFLGRALADAMSAAFETELFRVPVVIEPATYGLAMLIALLTAAASAFLVRRRVDRLNLVKVLKTRE